MWFLIISALAFYAMRPICRWYRGYLNGIKSRTSGKSQHHLPLPLSKRRTIFVIGVPSCTHLLQVHLHGEPHQLLHLLSYRQIRRKHPTLPDIPLRIPCVDSSRNPCGRPDRRPLRTQARDMGINSRHSTVQHADALHRTCNDGCSQLLRGIHAVVGLFRHTALLTGLLPNKLRTRFGTVFGFCLRHSRSSLGRDGQFRRQLRHRNRSITHAPTCRCSGLVAYFPT